MNGSFELIDYLIFGLYAVTILSIGLWVSRDKKGKQKNAEDYFLASKSLPWWAVGASSNTCFSPSITPPESVTLVSAK